MSAAGRAPAAEASPPSAVPFALGFALPPIVVLCAGLGGGWTWMPLAVVFGAVPIVDALAGVDRRGGREAPDPLDRNPRFRLVTWLWVPVQTGLLVWALRLVTSDTLSAIELAGVTASVGVCTGTIGFTFAHELVHRASRWERGLGEVLLATVTYPHFAVEHVHGHHRFVATPQDPATARRGESFYRFLPRAVLGGLRSAWHLEGDRVRRRYGTPWHPANRMLRYAAVQLMLYGALMALPGGTAALFFAAQSAVAIALLEVVNYIEHYGLVRREVGPGLYEPVQPWHSWDSYHRVTNWLLINLAHHADHHGLASRRYQSLAARDRAPELPAGYGAMFLLALVPVLWRRVMDPRVRAWREQHPQVG